jgi:hypothetical protein
VDKAKDATLDPLLQKSRWQIVALELPLPQENNNKDFLLKSAPDNDTGEEGWVTWCGKEDFRQGGARLMEFIEEDEEHDFQKNSDLEDIEVMQTTTNVPEGDSIPSAENTHNLLSSNKRPKKLLPIDMIILEA